MIYPCTFYSCALVIFNRHLFSDVKAGQPVTHHEITAITKQQQSNQFLTDKIKTCPTFFLVLKDVPRHNKKEEYRILHLLMTIMLPLLHKTICHSDSPHKMLST